MKKMKRLIARLYTYMVVTILCLPFSSMMGTALFMLRHERLAEKIAGRTYKKILRVC
ncbi:MAG: hypothetical protein NTX66_02615 [Candidatus Falkowbacteria bacterium]|nr:hypothetical protein [Candidatus Falkowbacteria bacterium]